MIESSMSDATIQDTLDTAQEEIEAMVGTQSSPSSLIGNAHLYLSACLLLGKMKTNGELPYMSKVGSIQQYNEKIDVMIKDYRDQYLKAIRKFTMTNSNANLGNLYSRTIPDLTGGVADDPDE